MTNIALVRVSDIAVQNPQVDEFLMHFGVPGMKWGKRKASYNDPPTGARRPRAQSGNSGSRYLAKNGGSQKKAIAKTVGKTLAVNYVLNTAGRTAVNLALKNHPSARKGANVALAGLGLANTALGARKTVQIHNAAKKKAKKS